MITPPPTNVPMFLDVQKGIMSPVWVQWFLLLGDNVSSSVMDLSPGAQSSMIAIPTASTTATTMDDSPLNSVMSSPPSISTDSSFDDSADPMGYVQPSALSTYNDTEDALTLFWMGA